MTKTGVVLGVSGQIGRAVARRMLSNSWSVRGLHNPDTALPGDLGEVEVFHADRNDDAALAAVLSNGVDGVVDTIAYTSAHARQLLRFADAIGALTVISSVAVYADDDGHSIGDGSPRWPTPIQESQTLVPATDETYGGGQVKAPARPSAKP
jgi:nucleoside-diphosphate-sugar epimerase